MAAALGRAVLPALIYLDLTVRPQGWTAPTVCGQPLPELAVSQVGVCNQPREYSLFMGLSIKVQQPRCGVLDGIPRLKIATLTLATERCSVMAMRAGRATPWRAPRSDRAPLHQSPAAHPWQLVCLGRREGRAGTLNRPGNPGGCFILVRWSSVIGYDRQQRYVYSKEWGDT